MAPMKCESSPAATPGGGETFDLRERLRRFHTIARNRAIMLATRDKVEEVTRPHVLRALEEVIDDEELTHEVLCTDAPLRFDRVPAHTEPAALPEDMRIMLLLKLHSWWRLVDSWSDHFAHEDGCEAPTDRHIEHALRTLADRATLFLALRLGKFDEISMMEEGIIEPWDEVQRRWERMRGPIDTKYHC